MLKVIQRIIQFTGHFSSTLCAYIVLYLCSRPKKYADSSRETLQLNQANKLTYKGATGTENIAWSWGEGPIVILCHGWEAKGAKMATLGIAIAQQGFQAIAIDCTAHGHSKGKRSNFDIMAQDIYSLSSQFSDIFAIVGHSMGGMMAMRARAFGLQANRYVLIGAPSAPLPIIDIMKNTLKVNAQTLAICQQEVASQIGLTWNELIQGKMYLQENRPLLMIYDTHDQEVPFFHAQKIQTLWQNSTIITTTGLSHRNIIWDHNVIQSIVTFLTQAPTKKQSHHQEKIMNNTVISNHISA
ncbi:alpha/beta hydrolase [uncultured Shewanella sp.]|uniref:alpha/beta hydrolase n=1 Tax=uncultured Shewanella sp. TaxID=173975 RepID=UPI002604D266|nr:alpha/beta hydrolase [uncultured Shewanella sp.]